MRTALSRYEKSRASVKPGIVTAIKSQKTSSRVSLWIDGEFAFGIAAAILTTKPVSIGQVLSVVEQQNLIDDDFRQKTRHAAFNYLSLQGQNG